jgi:hypothetical protein
MRMFRLNIKINLPCPLTLTLSPEGRGDQRFFSPPGQAGIIYLFLTSKLSIYTPSPLGERVGVRGKYNKYF